MLDNKWLYLFDSSFLFHAIHTYAMYPENNKEIIQLVIHVSDERNYSLYRLYLSRPGK